MLISLIPFIPMELPRPISVLSSVLFIFSCVLESFLRNRSSMDHEATAMMKAQFMSLWDGLDTSSNTQVTPLGTGLDWDLQQRKNIRGM